MAPRVVCDSFRFAPDSTTSWSAFAFGKAYASSVNEPWFRILSSKTKEKRKPCDFLLKCNLLTFSSGLL